MQRPQKAKHILQNTKYLAKFVDTIDFPCTYSHLQRLLKCERAPCGHVVRKVSQSPIVSTLPANFNLETRVGTSTISSTMSIMVSSGHRSLGLWSFGRANEEGISFWCQSGRWRWLSNLLPFQDRSVRTWGMLSNLYSFLCHGRIQIELPLEDLQLLMWGISWDLSSLMCCIHMYGSAILYSVIAVDVCKVAALPLQYVRWSVNIANIRLIVCGVGPNHGFHHRFRNGSMIFWYVLPNLISAVWIHIMSMKILPCFARTSMLWVAYIRLRSKDWRQWDFRRSIVEFLAWWAHLLFTLVPQQPEHSEFPTLFELHSSSRQNQFGGWTNYWYVRP